MECGTIEHTPDDLRRSLAPGKLIAVCERAFGREVKVVSAHELDGGEYNTTYLVRIAGMEPVILRVAPPRDARVFWHEEALMRKEHAIQPYFAPIATLMPRALAVDFTHQIIDRDYLFQTYMAGERWHEVADDLAPDDDEALWRQLAGIARTIHSVAGDAFGYPYPGPHFSSWSQTVLDYVAHVVKDVGDEGLDATDMLTVYRAAEENAAALDEIMQPCLTHGDLWPFNMLIERGAEGATIVAVLDADRAWWCDPMADWTAHLFRIKTSPGMLRHRAIFWDEYGPREQSSSAQLRELIYDGMHTGAILTSAKRRYHNRTFAESCDRLRRVAATLRSMALS